MAPILGLESEAMHKAAGRDQRPCFNVGTLMNGGSWLSAVRPGRPLRFPAILVLVARQLAVAIGTVGIATGGTRAGLIRLRTVLVLVARPFAVAFRPIRIAAAGTRAGQVGLRAVLVLVARRFAVAS